MGLSASLTGAPLTVAPGSSGFCEITVRNTGDVVDAFAVSVLGEAAGWSEAEPAVLNILPGESGKSRITFRPPRSAKVRAGTSAFGVRVASGEDPGSSEVHEGTVEVLPFDDLTADLAPRVAAGRRSARFDVTVDNRGNRPADADLFAEDGAAALRLRLAHSAVTVEPGTARLIRLDARPKRGFLRGDDKTLPFTVVVQPSELGPMETEGSMVQQALLPSWLLPAVAAVAALVLVLTAAWFTILKPQVKSTARAEAQQQISSAASAAAASSSAASNGSPGSSKTGSPSTGASSPTGPTGPSSSPETTPSKPAPAPVAFRLQTNAAPGASDLSKPSASILGKPLQISDILFQNPNGDAGTLQIMRQPAGGGPAVVLDTEGLANFRDFDFHLIQAWDFAAGDILEVAVSCTNQAVAPNSAKPCSAAVTFSGLSG